MRFTCSEIIMIGVDYDEPNPGTYRGVMVYGDNISERFESGDYNADLGKAWDLAHSLSDVVMISSSLDNYLSDRNDIGKATQSTVNTHPEGDE